MTRSILCLMIVALLAGCGKLPRPFQPMDGEARPSLPAIAFVHVPPIEGVSRPMAKLVADAAVEFLIDGDIPAATDPKNVPSDALILSGRARPPKNPDAGDAVDISWALTKPDGEVIGDYDQSIAGPVWKWQYGDPKMINLAGAGIARAVSKMLETPEDKLAAQATNTERRIGLMVTPVTGAPGDGDYALTRAIRNALRDSNITLSDDPRQAVYRLLGTVEMAKSRVEGQQRVKITWRIIDHQRGKTIGEASQANLVPEGSLDGRWGEIAGYAALAAVDGIKSLLNEGEASYPNRAAPVSPPPTPVMPGLKGRAPPPPS